MSVRIGTNTVSYTKYQEKSVGKYQLLERIKDDNNNEIGTVSGFFTDENGVEYAVVCLDAQYRRAGGSGVTIVNSTTEVTGLTAYDANTWGAYIVKETATFNTQTILDFADANNLTSTVCSHCRSQSFVIDGVTYYGQLPNLPELLDIAKYFKEINNKDTSAESYTTTNFSESRGCWSSNKSKQAQMWTLTSLGATSRVNVNTTGSSFVVPVLELPNE